MLLCIPVQTLEIINVTKIFATNSNPAVQAGGQFELTHVWYTKQQFSPNVKSNSIKIFASVFTAAHFYTDMRIKLKGPPPPRPPPSQKCSYQT